MAGTEDRQGPALGIALGFQRLHRFLASQLFIQRQRGGGGAARFLDLPVDFADVALQPHFQVVGPAIQLGRLFLEIPGVPLGNGAADAIPLAGVIRVQLV